MQRAYSQPKTQRFDHVDNQLRDYCDKNKIHYDLSKFAVIRGTLDGAVKATKRYDKPDVVPKMTAHEVAAIKDELRKIFERHYDSCPMSLDEDIDMKPDSSPGSFFKVLYGVKKTKEILRSEFFKQMLYAFHRQPEYPTLWQTSAKQELLPGEKVINNEPRTFIIPDKRYHYHCLKLLGTQHALLKRLATQRGSWSAIGKSFQNRGYHSIMAEFEKFKIKGEGDASKWDASLLSYIFTEFIIPLRVELFEPPRQIVVNGSARDATAGERTQMRTDYAKSLRDLYEDMLHAYVMLPDGEVIQFPLGMKSGFFTTSDDNTLYHLVIVLLLHLRTHLVFGKDSEWVLYADDHVFGTDSKLLADFETRKAVYADCGVTLKPAADRVATTVDGMTFLGYTAMWSKGHAAYVPVYNHEKALASLLQPDGAQDDAMRYIRMSALRMVCYFTPIRDVMRDMCTHFYDEKFADLSSPYPSLTDEQFKKLAQPITDSAIEKLWLGQEDGKRNILDFLMSGRANTTNASQAKGKNNQRARRNKINSNGGKGANSGATVRKSRKRKSNRAGKRKQANMPIAASYVRSEQKSGMRGMLAGESNCQYGSDIVQVSTTGGSPSAFADIVDQYFCHPATLLTGTRLNAFSNLYEKYRWKKFTLRWEPKVSVEFSGDVFAFYIPNPNQSVTKTGVNLIQDATSRKYCKLGPVSRPLTLNIPKFAMTNAPNQKFVLDIENADEALDTYAGKICFGLDGAATPNTAYGYWRLDWGIEFYDPVNEAFQNASAAQYVMTADSGQSKPFGSAIASTNYGDPELISISTNGSSNVINFSHTGNYDIIVFFPSPSGGAALTAATTWNVTSGVTINFNDTMYEGAQVGKRWWFDVTVANLTDFITVSDSAGTHPTSAAVVTVTHYQSTVPQTKAQKRDVLINKTKMSLEDRLRRLEKLGAGLDLGQIETEASTSVSTNYGNSAPVTTVTTTTVDQVAPIETVAAGLAVRHKKKKPVLFHVVESDSDS